MDRTRTVKHFDCACGSGGISRDPARTGLWNLCVRRMEIEANSGLDFLCAVGMEGGGLERVFDVFPGHF